MPSTAASRRGRAAPDRLRMGERLRALRKSHGLTLKALASRSGVALSTLSKMELGQITASYEKFAAVARALQVDIAQLFDPRADARPARVPTVVRTTLGEAPGYDTGHYDYRMLSTAYPARRMTPMHGKIRARRVDEFPDFIRHPGQEFAMVLSGRLRIEFETGEAIQLGRGESAYFDSGVGHVYLSVGKSDAQVIVVMA
ncbi:MAG TPA: XRE family transcriptional regulator [Albitalea sp.]|uniref:helix-turn-helix domain-containing protein n=1 Tax=Piscinibacter sp. TaxID=1903157 RepID=UPI002ED0660B